MKLISLKYIFIYSFLILFFCSNSCAPELTLIHFNNKSNVDVIVFSKDELQYHKDGFLSKNLINDRTIKKRDDSYLGFDKFELENFKLKKNEYCFFIKKITKNSKNDSIIINSKNISLSKQENVIIYKENKIYFINKN